MKRKKHRKNSLSFFIRQEKGKLDNLLKSIVLEKWGWIIQRSFR
jgi:hypothetical protein